jgi:hypothetical protein
LGGLATALAAAGRFAAALKIARSIDPSPGLGEDIRAPALTEVAAALARTRRFKHAERVARSCAGAKWRARALCHLGSVLAEQGSDRARAVLAEAEQLATHLISDNSTRSGELADLAVVMTLAGDAHGDELLDAAETAARQVDDRIQPESLSHLVSALIRVRQFKRAEGITRSLPEVGSRVASLAALAKALREYEPERSHSLFVEAETLALGIPDMHQQGRAMLTLTQAIARSGDLINAERLTRAIPIAINQAGALHTLAAAMARAGDAAAAERVARSIPDAAVRSDALSDAATSLVGAGRHHEALKMLGAPTMDHLLRDLASWGPAFEQARSGLSVAVLSAATEVAGWVRADWADVHEVLTSSKHSA